MASLWRALGLVCLCYVFSACGLNEEADTPFDTEELIFTELPEVVSQEVSEPEAAEDEDSAEEAVSFLEEPGTCDDFYSLGFYCDGFTPYSVNLDGSNNLTPENLSSVPPKARFNGLQVLGPFDGERPTMIYVHGWNTSDPGRIEGMPNYWVLQAQKAGFNTVYFSWSELSFDDGSACAGLSVFGGPGIPCKAGFELFKENGAGDIFLRGYQELFANTTGAIRIIGHSLGATLSTYVSYRLHTDPQFSIINKPDRIDLIDPYVNPGLGSSRTDPFDGQIPADVDLPVNVVENLVTDFVGGSACHAEPEGLLPANHLSQYCQVEGMIYSLLVNYDVPTAVFSSIVSTAVTNDLSKVALTQKFSVEAFRSDLLALHSAPVPAYMFSFSDGEPINGIDASTSDDKILSGARAQAIDGINMSVRQTSGFETITLGDDAYELLE